MYYKEGDWESVLFPCLSVRLAIVYFFLFSKFLQMTNYCYLCNVVNGCAYKVLGKDLCIKEVDVYSVLAWIISITDMNTNMYENPIIQRNISTLKEYGYNFVEPESGRPAVIIIFLPTKSFSYCSKLTTLSTITSGDASFPLPVSPHASLPLSGPTIESIDPVRYLTNRSSGKMGYAIARVAAARGAEVILISGKTNIKPPVNIKKFINITSAEDMYQAVVSNLDQNDVVIKSAAVADYN